MREKSQYGKKNKAEIVKNKTEKVKNRKKIAPGRRPELRKMGRSNFSLMKRKIIMKLLPGKEDGVLQNLQESKKFRLL